MSVAIVGSTKFSYSGGGVQSETFSLTVTAGTNCLVITDDNANGSGGLTPTSITYNGVALTMVPASSEVATSIFETSIWYLLNPPTGTAYNLVITYSATASTGYLMAGAIFLSGVNTSNPVGTAAINTGTGVAGASVTATGGGPNDLYIATAFVYGSTMTVGGGQTSLQQTQGIGGITSADTSYIPGSSAGSFTWSATGTTNSSWAASAVAFLAPTVTPNLLSQICL